MTCSYLFYPEYEFRKTSTPPNTTTSCCWYTEVEESPRISIAGRPAWFTYDPGTRIELVRLKRIDTPGRNWQACHITDANWLNSPGSRWCAPLGTGGLGREGSCSRRCNEISPAVCASADWSARSPSWLTASLAKNSPFNSGNIHYFLFFLFFSKIFQLVRNKPEQTRTRFDEPATYEWFMSRELMTRLKITLPQENELPKSQELCATNTLRY